MIHDYESFRALNETVGVASGRVFDWLVALGTAGLLAHDGSERPTIWTSTERGRLAAYLVRATLEDYVSDSGA